MIIVVIAVLIIVLVLVAARLPYERSAVRENKRGEGYLLTEMLLPRIARQGAVCLIRG